MARLLFLLIFLIVNVVFLVSVDRLGFIIQPGSYIDGLIVAAIIGYIWMWLGNWWGIVHRPFEPMRVVHETRQTPAQVNRAMLWAIVRGILIIAVLLVAAIVFIATW